MERAAADNALSEEQVAIDDIADAVITRARERADDVLAETRAKADQSAVLTSRSTQASQAMSNERAVEDRVLREERAGADEILREERAEHVALLSTERKETDKDLLRERTRSDVALATRDDFLGIVSHDLRSMLNSMVLFAGLIAEDVQRPNHAESIARQALHIQRSGARMSRLIGDLIDVASIESGALTVVLEQSDPAHVVTEAIDIFQAHATAHGVALTATIVPPLPLVAFDSARILQVLINLLGNAIKFTPKGGKVTVHAERVDNELRFSVRDTGAGIPLEKQEAVFERFLQLGSNDRRGVGLGLYISKCIVHGHRGRIWVESALGTGSSFHIALPLAASTTGGS